MFSQDKESCELIEVLGKELYLKHHIVEDAEKRKMMIVGPADMELHKGIGDNNYYLIDLARMFPPDVDAKNPNTVFFQLFRFLFLFGVFYIGEMKTELLFPIRKPQTRVHALVQEASLF